jgi:hypothetical protein
MQISGENEFPHKEAIYAFPPSAKPFFALRKRSPQPASAVFLTSSPSLRF